MLWVVLGCVGFLWLLRGYLGCVGLFVGVVSGCLGCRGAINFFRWYWVVQVRKIICVGFFFSRSFQVVIIVASCFSTVWICFLVVCIRFT